MQEQGTLSVQWYSSGEALGTCKLCHRSLTKAIPGSKPVTSSH